MKQTSTLTEGWYLKEATYPLPYPADQESGVLLAQLAKEDGWLSCAMPAVVQEVLFDHRIIKKDVLETGIADECAWVSTRDWIFRTSFPAPSHKGPVYLEFQGLDTVVDIYLNGNLLCCHESMFMPLKTRNIRDLLQESNELILCFHAPCKVIETFDPPKRYEGKISSNAMLRKAHGDFTPHGGAVPYFTPIGVYDEIFLVCVDQSEIFYADIETSMDQHNIDGTLEVFLHRTCCDGVSARLRLYGPGNSLVADSIAEDWREGKYGMPVCHFTIGVEKPQLWWPRNYGSQPLYFVKVELSKEGVLLDSMTRTIGFRKIEIVGDMRFRVNGMEIKMWGSCITPMWGCTHKWIRERGKQFLDYAARGNMNALRLWGPGQPYHEEFYEYACELGILIWQEFHTSGTHIPDTPKFVDLVMREAEIEIRRLKHYPCIFMWCGGNEHIYMADIFDPEARVRIGYDLILYHLKDLVAKMDRSRYYHASSPCGGRFPNEAIFSDNHGSRAAQCYLPGEAHGHLFSENIRTFTPELKSMKRFIPEQDLWPQGYSGTMPFNGATYPIPETWRHRTINNFEKKTGPYELFYDPTDVYSLIYRLNAAAAHDIREIISKQRHGKPFYESAGDRHCNGHFIWKLDTAWPQIYCAFIDYYMEPGMPYYMLRRQYAPVLVSLDMQDHIYVWGVNDTAENFAGTVTVEVYELDKDAITQSITFPVGIPVGDSLVLKSLDCFGHTQLRSVVHCMLTDADGQIVSEDYQYLISERRLPFPNAKLTLRQEGEHILVSTDRFARCVELQGNAGDDAFGWQFEDNYFDLVPGREKIIRIWGMHKFGTITAKAHYSSHVASVLWKRHNGG